MTRPPAPADAPRPRPAQSVEAYRETVRQWVADIQARSGDSPADIAKRGGVSASTLYRWFDPKLGLTPSQAKLVQIAAAYGVPPPGASPLETPPGLAEAPQSLMRATPPADEATHPDMSWWRVGDRSLELAGYLPGDRVKLDQRELARAGDAVIAQIYDFERGAAETQMRIFDPPFLVTRTMDPALTAKPLLVDNERVKIMGPIVRMTRSRE